MGEIISVTQQNISKYENDIYEIPTDVLIKISRYFNVSIEYLLGVTDIKRDMAGQVIVNKTLDEYYDLIESFKSLEQEDQELVWTVIEKMTELMRRRQ